MSDEILQIGSLLQKVETKEDKTLKITLHTNETTPEQSSLLMKMVHNFGWFFFKMNELTKEDVDVKEKAPNFKGERTPAQRLRNVLFVFWNQTGKPLKNFDLFYAQEVEAYIDQIKSKLEPENQDYEE